MKRMIFASIVLLSAVFVGSAAAHTADDPCVTDLLAGQHIDAGDVKVWNDDANLYVQYVTEGGWELVETHLHVATSLQDIPQTKKGNPIPGQFEYFMYHDPPVTEYTYAIPLTWDPCTELCIAAHAVVRLVDGNCIDFEEYSEFDTVSTVSTDLGDVDFYMVSSLPLAGLSLGDDANLTPIPGSYPVIAEGDTKPPDENIVAFTVNDTQFGGTDPLRDDYLRDDRGTGAAGKLLTDPQDLSQIPLLRHAFSQYQAIVVDLSAVEGVLNLSLAAIDLDFTEVWTFQYFNAMNQLLHQVVLGPAGDQSGDGAAFPVTYTGPSIAKLAIWGGNNLGVAERIGYAVDNICLTAVIQEETAWGDGFDFPGRNWATYIKYRVQQPCDAATECADFSVLNTGDPGDPVEGLGTVHPQLDIQDNLVGDSQFVVKQGVDPLNAYNSIGGINGCIGDAGFGNYVTDEVDHDLTFEFAPGITVSSFSIKMYDYGDWFPVGTEQNMTHTVKLVAYSGVVEVDSDTLTFTTTGGGSTGRTMTTLNNVDIADIGLGESGANVGDSCGVLDYLVANPGSGPWPGRWEFQVQGSGIDKVELLFIDEDASGANQSLDPGLALNEVCFEIECP